MNKIEKIVRREKTPTVILSILVVLLLMNTFVSCQHDELIHTPDLGSKEGYMKIELNLPDFMEPTTASTRAMDDKAEAAITKDGLEVLVFRHDGKAPKFNYKAPVSALDSVKGEPHKAIATIKLVKSKNATEKFDIVVIANYTIDDAILVKDAELDDILDKLQYDMPTDGKWKATTGNSTPFPMYGKTIERVVTEDMKTVNVSLHRALARIDVGLNLNSSGDKLLETAVGIGNFELEDVYVFKTNNKGYVKGYTAPSITQPNEDLPVNVPSDAERNKDPLHFKLNADQTKNHVYVREIYVPETETIQGTDDVHCIVVGGLFEDDAGNKVKSYYRLDFAEWVENEENKEIELRRLSITRNHRYIFNIKGIRFAGATSAADAFKNGFNPPSEGFEYSLLVWNEDIHEMHVHGKYHFGLDSRDVVLGGKASDLDTTAIEGNYKEMVYQTNYPLTLNEGITFEWDNPIAPDNKSISEHFKVEWDKSLGAKGVITITAKKRNLTGNNITDVLTVKAGSFRIKVNVTQQYINFNYTLDCGTLRDYGTYKAGVKLGAEHYLAVNIIAEDRSAQDEEYELWVEKTNGISFRVKGVFDFSDIPSGSPLIVPVKLTLEAGTQMIPKDVLEPFTLIVHSNSPLNASCEIDITPVFTYNMVMAATAKNTSININKPNTGPYKVLNSKVNYGPNYNSLVKIAGFNYITFDNGETPNVGYVTSISGSGTDAEKWIRGTGGAKGQIKGQIADIVYLSYNTSIKEDDAKMYNEYMEKGGVIILFLEYAPDIRYFVNGALGINIPEGTASGIGVQGGKDWWQTTDGDFSTCTGNVIPFPANDILATTEEAKATALGAYEDDMVLNGPFGDVREQQWGQDNWIFGRVPISYIENLPGIKIYSQTACWRWQDRGNTNNRTVIWDSRYNKTHDRSKYVSGFKSETDTRNFVWFGDSGFMSSGWTGSEAYVSVDKEDPTKGDYKDRGLEPFAWDKYDFPAPKYFTQKDTYNSTVFCNVFAWALKRSDQLRTKREGYINK